MDKAVAGPSILLYDGGVLDNLRTLWYALRSYYARQLADPTTLVMLLHLLLTVVHFITWASSYGGVDGLGPAQVCLWRPTAR